MKSLPEPEIVSCFFDETVAPHLPAMELNWDLDSPGLADRDWRLPEGIVLRGGPPERFGVVITRGGDNAFRVHCVWNRTTFHWERLTRGQILSSAIAPLLAALRTDVWYLLDQPVDRRLARAA